MQIFKWAVNPYISVCSRLDCHGVRIANFILKELRVKTRFYGQIHSACCTG